MKSNKMAIMALGLGFGVFSLAGEASAVGVVNSDLNEQGSLLVYPLVDSLTNGNDTIIDIANTTSRGTWPHCNIEVHGAGSTDLVKEDFQIYLTPFQKIWWKLSQGYSSEKLHNKYGL